jgi:glycolate oxidase iron-sulfur subunit
MKNIETENVIEEINEIIEKCINCGMCKGRCPVFKALREEVSSPRGRVNILKEKVFDNIFFNCSLCKSCEVNCPLGLKLPDAFRNARKVIAELGKDPKGNREMLDNTKKFGNPFGKTKPGKIDKMYCC